MSYADAQALSTDGAFQGRMWACLSTEAQGKDASDPLATYILADPWQGVRAFTPFISTAPGFPEKYAAGGQESITDLDLLSATQAAWPRVQVPS